MKITFINTHDIIGGAERCSYDLATSFRKQGDEASLVVGGKLGKDDFVRQLTYGPLDAKFRHFVFNTMGLTDSTLMAPIRNCFTWPELKRADVYNVHNMHGSYWNFWTLPVLARRAPVVLTLHDEWFMTGDCAYTYDCDRWKGHCGSCPQAAEPEFGDRYAIGGGDATWINLALKRMCAGTVPAKSMAIVSPSRWLLQRAQQAPHLSKYAFHLIENGVDLVRYRPLDRSRCRRELNLPEGKALVAAVAARHGDRRKNFSLIDTLVRSGGWPQEAVLVLAGRFDEEEKKRYSGLPVVFLGYLDSPDAMARALSACDLSLILSRADNLPYTGLESLACGCPVVGTTVGGIPEIIDDGVTGWLVPPDCGAVDLGRVIHAIVRSKPDQLSKMRQAARESAEARFGMGSFVDKYRKLFEALAKRCA